MPGLEPGIQSPKSPSQRVSAQRPNERLNSKAGIPSSHVSPTECSRTVCGKRTFIQDIRQARAADADRAVGPPRGLKRHSWRRIVALYSDRVKNIDGRAIARMANPIAAIIGADQPDTRLVIRGEGNIARPKAPGVYSRNGCICLPRRRCR
jgi:hypothetical protein